MSDETTNFHRKSENVNKALSQLKKAYVDPAEALNIAKKLKAERAFGYARKLLAHAFAYPATAIDPKQKLNLSQQLALCTYKDPDLPPADRLDNAFRILNQADPLDVSHDQESLGIAGAIYKRKWEHGNHKQHLERSLAYYQRGYELTKEKGWAEDQGYNAINAAFVLDLLAVQEDDEARKAGTVSEMAIKRFAEAEAIRREIVDALPPLMQTEEHQWMAKKWWVLVTTGEAFFGLGEYAGALAWLRKANAIAEVPDWERESTARQLAALLRLRTVRRKGFETERSAAEKVLREFLGDEAAAASVLTGKIGLALSGGGFRASLYHIGVLARLAELDLLRHIEVISCVSGGSIIGAHYYLEVRNLLENTLEKDIKPQGYIDIVRRIEKEFLEGVQTNVRTRVITNLIDDLRMIFSPDYSRTNRVGRLYEENIFSKITDDKQRLLNELKIIPAGENEKGEFSPKDQNWRRRAKVPILVLNATALNTGHNWQFTASWMGEPPSGIDTEIDANYRLRRMYYKDAPEKFQNLRLGDAVAASSCVPGLFEPLALSGLYEGITVRLVDGGVYDNQGTAGLLDQGCSILLVSDASGQMESQNQPSSGMLGVPLRSNSILQSRVRSAQYHELDARLRSELLQGLMYIHLKKELTAHPMDWLTCEERTVVEAPKPVTSYDINRQYQAALADIRTDLDSFTDNEAHALMLSGYRMTEHYCPETLSDIVKPAGPQPWEFLRLDSTMKQEAVDKDLLKQLLVGGQNFFKVWKLSSCLQVVAAVSGVLLVTSLVLWLPDNWGNALLRLTVGGLALLVLSILANRLGGGWVLKLFRYKKTLKEIAIGVVALTIGWAAAQVHLKVFDRLFLCIGKKAP